MIRTFSAYTLTGIGLLVFPLVARAEIYEPTSIYSPTQAELLDMAHVDFIDNIDQLGNPVVDNDSIDNIQADGAGVRYTYTTDYDNNDALWRTAALFQNTATTWPLDFTPYDEFRIDFSNLVGVPGAPLSGNAVQIFLRASDGGGGEVQTSGSTYTVLSSSSDTATLSIRKSDVDAAAGDWAQITSFGIEFFGGDEFLGGAGQMVTAQTSPQPPTFNTLYQISSWETPDDPGTTGVNEQFEGWTEGFQPDHVHSISTTGATDGSYALRIDRTVTGDDYEDAGVEFRWGSQRLLDIYAGGGGAPLGDYNSDGTTDAADYTVWRDNLGTSYALPNRDPGSTGNVSEADFTAWKDNFGAAGGGPDPDAVADLAAIVDAVNDVNSYGLSFDLTMDDGTPIPPYLILDIAISTTDGGEDVFWQASEEISLSELNATGTSQQRINFPLSDFHIAGTTGGDSLKVAGLDPDAEYLNVFLASNTNAAGYPTTYSFYIDNFQIRGTVPAGVGSLAATAVPEPSAVVLALLAGLAAIGFRRR